MSQYPTTFNDPYGDAMMQPRKTSGLAIAALVCSAVLCCPVTTVLGVVLGAVALITIAANPTLKGKGLAITAILLGLIFTTGQIVGGMWFYNTFVKPVLQGPREAMVAGFAGDISGFKSHFYGSGATAPDSEATAFIDELRDRYGSFVSVEFDERSGQPARGKPGQAEMPFPYVITFQNQSVSATGVYVFADESTDAVVLKWRSITVHDPVLGDISYPTGSPGSKSPVGPVPQPGPAGTPR